MQDQRGNRGFILPTLTAVTVILLILATALMTAGTMGLRTATFDQQADQALFAAEAGLVKATSAYMATEDPPTHFHGTLEGTQASYEVEVIENPDIGERPLEGGLILPPRSLYFHAKGLSENKTQRETGALFRYGMAGLSVGALGNQVNITGSKFDAYNSDVTGEYSSVGNDSNLPLLATNTSNGDPVHLTNSEIRGEVFVGPNGGDEQVVSDSLSEYGNVNPLAEPITLEDVPVPADPNPGTGGSPPWDIPPLGDLQVTDVSDGLYHFDDGHGLKFSFNLPDDPLEGSGMQLAQLGADCVVPGSGVSVTAASGTEAGQPYSSVVIQVTGASPPRYVELRPGGVAFYIDGSGVFDGSTNPTAQGLANLLFNGTTPGDGENDNPVNPDTIDPGHYDTLTVNGNSETTLADGVYVFKNLNIEAGSTLKFPADGTKVTIFVTESMSVDGVDTIVNETHRAPKMNIFYKGQNEVKLGGGSQSYYTLIAEDATVTLSSLDEMTQFFGALVGNAVNVNNAEFHYDTATTGIGAGVRGTGIILLNRHRL